MKSAPYFVIATVLAAGLTLSGIAHGAHHGEKSTMHGTQAKGMHQMSGTITAIDHDKGMLSLQTGVGDLKLHFPPDAIKDLKEGDRITVHLGYTTQ